MLLAIAVVLPSFEMAIPRIGVIKINHNAFADVFFKEYPQSCCAPINADHGDNAGVSAKYGGRRKLNADCCADKTVETGPRH